MTGTVGKEDYGNVCEIDTETEYLLNQRVGKFVINNELLDSKYLLLLSNNEAFRSNLFGNTSGGVRQANISSKGVESIKIPLPPLEIQKQIVAEIEAEQQIINANKKLIEIFEAKIHRTISKIWGSN